MTSPSGVTTTWALVNRSSSPATSSVTPTRDRHAEPRRLGGDGVELGAAGERGDVDDVLRPHHEVELVIGGDRRRGVEVALRDDGAGDVVGAGSLLAASLNDGDVENVAGAVATRRDDADEDDGNGGEAAGGHEAHVDGGAGGAPHERRRGRRRSARRPR